MDPSAILTWAEENLDTLKDLLGLSEWEITFTCVPNTDKNYASVTTNLKYLEARIVVNPVNITCPDHLQTIVEHELLHIHHAAFDMSEDYVRALIGEEEGNKADRFEVVWSHSMEMTVKSLERMLKSFRERMNASNGNGIRKRQAKG